MMKFTEDKRAEIKDAILIRCSGTDLQTFQIEELDRMVDEIEKLVMPIEDTNEVRKCEYRGHNYEVDNIGMCGRCNGTEEL